MSATIKDAALREAEGVIENLQALIRGECPSLFDEDSGGKPQDDIDCYAALASIRKALSSGASNSDAPDWRAIAEKLAGALIDATNSYEHNVEYKSAFLREKHGDQIAIAGLRIVISEFQRAKGNGDAGAD